MNELEATTAAQDLCSRLGTGWEPRVWENLGWHFTAELRRDDSEVIAEVRQNYSVTDEHTYTAEVRPGVAIGAVGLQQNGIKAAMQCFSTDPDPARAVRKAWKHMAVEAQQIMAAVQAATFRLAEWELRG